MALLPVLLDVGERQIPASGAAFGGDAALDLRTLTGGGPERPWEVEIGFGKGRYLLGRATAEPERCFLGIEIVSKYQRLVAGRARRKGLSNTVIVRGDALYLMSALLPRGFAEAVHVYHPDPWPKKRHQKRRLFDPESVDLVLGLLRPGGKLLFGTDFLDYGRQVRNLLEAHPALRVQILDGLWPGGARTNYEAKYIEEGRPILRLEARLSDEPQRCNGQLHPAGCAGVLSAWAPKPDDEE